MPVEALAELLDGDLLGHLGRPHAADLDLQEVEDVAVHDQLDVAPGVRAVLVVLEKLGEAVVVEELLERVRLAGAHARAEVHVRDDDAELPAAHGQCQ